MRGTAYDTAILIGKRAEPPKVSHFGTLLRRCENVTIPKRTLTRFGKMPHPAPKHWTASLSVENELLFVTIFEKKADLTNAHRVKTKGFAHEGEALFVYVDRVANSREQAGSR